MSIGMKKIVALMLALLMVFAIVACAKNDADPADSETEPETSETTAAPADDGGDDNSTPTPDGGNNNNQGTTPDPDPKPEPEPEPEPAPIGDFTLVEKSNAKFAVVSKDSNYDAMATKFAEDLTDKTGVLFMVKDKPSSGEKALYIGTNPSSILGSKISDLTYNGYVMHDVSSNIHLTGYTKATIQASIDAFLAAITPETVIPEENNKMTIKLSNALLKIYNPAEGYAYRNAKLLGKSISEFIIVLPANYTVYDRFVADELIARIGADTGYKLEYIKDSKMTGNLNQIVIGKTSRDYSSTVYAGLATDTYLIKSEGTSVYAAYENYLVSTEVASAIAAMYKANATTVNETETFDYSAYLFERPEDTSIRIMSNNITVVQDAYSYERANNIEWRDRMEILSQMYLKYLPDFIGLQEVQYDKALEADYYGSGYSVDMYGYLQERLAPKYSMLGETSRMTAIFYQSDVWKLEASGQGQFNAMHPWYWGLFSRIDDPTVQVIVMDIHYAGEGVVFDHNNKYADGPAEFDGKTNGQVINIIYNQLNETYAGVPIFVLGDFNSKYNGANFNATIKNTTLDSASRMVEDWGDHYSEVSLNHGMFANPIDHILVPTDKADAISYRFINEALTGISSGHRPIMADIKLYPVVSGSGNGMNWSDGVAPSN